MKREGLGEATREPSMSQDSAASVPQQPKDTVTVLDNASGRSVEFPANALRRHVSRDGVYGLFEIVCDADHRLIRIDRIGD